MFKKNLGVFALALVPLLIGIAVGLSIPLDFIRDKIAASMEEATPAADDAHAATDSNSVQLSQTSQDGMGLSTDRIKYSDFQSTFEVPAFVREIPGASDLHVSSRFAGLVRKVLISEGQTVVPGQPILEIDLTGDLLATAQAELLDAQKQISIVSQEITRLEPSVRSGGVANKRLIKTRYERDRLAAKVETKTQELLVRGITQDQINEILTTKKLLRSITVHVPEDLVPPQLNAGNIMKDSSTSFLVERLLAKPGSMAQLGDNLCELSFHAVLVVEGQAYEKDLSRVRESIANGTPISVSIGPGGAHEHIADLQIAFLSNHVDNETNTYPFYIYLKNENLFGKLQTSKAGQPGYSKVAFNSQTSDDYVTWKWKPGQRAHVEIQDKVFEKAIVIPREALAVDGLKNYVYRWGGVVECDHPHPDDEPVAEEAHAPEFADKFDAVEVIVIHKDRRYVVVKVGEKLKLGDRIAINNAGRLLFAMQAGSGGGNSHGHAH